ncbi:hypothetical protein IFT73_04090 [Aeromicrobium sp. CFBP 8757]|uniref:hypothetical protein n=1 Tax=Aeromicrobium sp. CFBP 8757 TaxID=2775288 RepID=UPI00177CB874|nr:hypothetical protein [Aeromicrobium sp. CFBP 8757]MBD8606024.1 hypothetical protein [Aeromicrobium sp. CFBP 8757]
MTNPAGEIVRRAFDKALLVQGPIAAKQVENLKRRHPDEPPGEILKRLNTIYLSSVTSTGAAAGAAAVVPGPGVPAAIADAAFFTEATVLYILARSHIYDLKLNDVERKQALVLSIMVGDSVAAGIPKMAQRTGRHWARKMVEQIPMSSINSINKVLGPRFVTKYGAKQGVIVLGKQAPLGFGAAIGAGANHITARLMVKQANQIFGEPPPAFGGGTFRIR